MENPKSRAFRSHVLREDLAGVVKTGMGQLAKLETKN